MKALVRYLITTVWMVLVPVTAWAAPVPPRAARSVHLFYQAPPGRIFFNSVRIRQSQRGSYFEVCGFSQGYFGLQELDNRRRVLIFSVWDSAHHKVLVAYHAPGIHVKRFGGEGTGAHIVYPYRWRRSRTYACAVVASRVKNRTAYAAWFYRGRQHIWQHLVTLSTVAGKSAGLISGCYAFIEDFRRNTRSAGEMRRAWYGPGWLQEANGRWRKLTRAVFTTSDAPWEARKTVDAGVNGQRFYLQTGGRTQERHRPGTLLRLPHLASGLPPMLKKFIAALANGQRTTNNEQRTTNNEQRTTNNGQRTTNNEQRTTDNEQRTMDNGQRTTNNGQRTTDNGQRITDNEQRTTDNEQRTTDNGQRTTGNGQRTTNNEQRTTNNGQRATDNGQRATDNGQRTTGNGQRTTDNGQRATGNGQRTP